MKTKNKKVYQFPIIIERDEDGYFIVECPVFSGCYSQGETFDEAIKNIREVIDLCLEEKQNQKILKDYKPKDFTLYSLAYA